MSLQFKMKVNDLFFIGNKVVFAGDLETDEVHISNADCKILVDGIETSRININGDVMGTGHRDLWTTSSVELERSVITTHDVWLVSI